MTAMLDKAFADPVHDARRCFRAILDAMSHPGRIVTVSGVRPPPGLSLAAAATLLTLADHETPLWLAPGFDAARSWILFHCGSPLATDPATSAFALTVGVPPLTDFRAGTHEEPETSTTLICEISGFDAGARFRLTGPGLREHADLTIDGVGANFAPRWRANRALFPCGADLILCAGDRLCALPRTVAIEEI